MMRGWHGIANAQPWKGHSIFNPPLIFNTCCKIVQCIYDNWWIQRGVRLRHMGYQNTGFGMYRCEWYSLNLVNELSKWPEWLFEQQVFKVILWVKMMMEKSFRLKTKWEFSFLRQQKFLYHLFRRQVFVLFIKTSQ